MTRQDDTNALVQRIVAKGLQQAETAAGAGEFETRVYLYDRPHQNAPLFGELAFTEEEATAFAQSVVDQFLGFDLTATAEDVLTPRASVKVVW